MNTHPTFNLSGSTILITGGTGFVGSHLVEALLAQGCENIFVTSYSGAGDYLSDILPAERILKADLSDRAATMELFASVQPEVVFHLASIAVVGSSFEKAAEIFHNNISLQLNVLDAIKMHVPTARVLIIGSGAEYGVVQPSCHRLIAPEQLQSHQVADDQFTGRIDESFLLNPTSPYAVSKVTQDLLALSYVYSYDLDIVRARPFNHTGERQTTDFAVPAFAEQIVKIERGEQDAMKVGNVEAIRDFSDVKDVVRAYITLVEKGQRGEVYNVGSGRGYAIQTILDMMCSLSHSQINVVVDQSRVRPVDVPVAIANIDKILHLGWEPVIPLEQTIQRVLEEWRAKMH